MLVARNLWSRDEMILALNLYLKMPFGKMHKTNPEVIRVAKLIGRTPDAVAYRLVNYASCDPMLKQRGISGMQHGGPKCQQYWDEFSHDREKLIYESEAILARYEQSTIEEKYQQQLQDIPDYLVGAEKLSLIKQRVNQDVFRSLVMANFNGKCALTGIDIPELLVASHIIPWAMNEKERLNPSNGICLSALYDKAFDKGIISFDENNRTIFSSKLEKAITQEYYAKYFLPIKGKELAVPGKYNIDKAFLEWHRDCIFEKE